MHNWVSGNGRKHREDFNHKQLQELQEGTRSAREVSKSGDDSPVTVDVEALEADLKRQVKGEVRFDTGSRALYATDASNYRQVPIGVVIPKSKEDIIVTVALCRKYGAPIVSRGGGTSLAGQTCNVAVVMDMSKYYNQILWLDADKKQARIQPGIVLDELRDAAEKHNLTFGPDPSTHNRCTLGGMMGNNSCGVHALMAGKTAENVISMQILTYDGEIFEVGKTSDEQFQQIIAAGGRRGEIYRQLKELIDANADRVRKEFPHIPRRVSGYNLDDLLPENGFDVARALVGTEGTCVTILEATVRLVYSPPGRTLVVLGYKDVYSAGDHVKDILKFHPIGLEALDDLLIEYMKRKNLHPRDTELLPPGGGWLLVEFGGKDKKESDAKGRAMMDALKEKSDAPSMHLYDDPVVENLIWLVRESGLGATTKIPGEKDTWPGFEDSAVDPTQLGGYLRELQQLFEKYHYKVSVYGHFGQGCVHCSIPFNLKTEDGIEEFRRFMSEAGDLVVKYGGSLSGEHGDGQARAELLGKMYSSELLQAFHDYKKIWDPQWKMNPGKKINAHRIVDDLRLGTNYEPWLPQTNFQYPDDHYTFARAANRCVGAGECRRHDGGTMCPSYIATREEMHSTRGRARLLFEMLQGNPLENGWRNETVREALDLCLACKGCKNDCPVNVDMATYKSEFLSHYYDKRLRPRNAYAFGLIHIWSRFASKVPEVVNFLTQTPGLSVAAKLAAGMDLHRTIPKFASQTFLDWWKQRPPQNIGKPLVLLWPDTFNNHFHPQTAQAAVEVLEHAGFQIYVPTTDMCCGRPLYDYGFVPLAKKWLLKILDTIRPYIRAGVPVIVLEPSCGSVFKDELIQLFPHDADAQRLNQQTYYLAEFLQKHTENYRTGQLAAKAIVQGHCHQKSLVSMSDDLQALKAMGVDYDTPEVGCCGMAGAFGFEQGDHYGVSRAVGDRNLVPAVRNAPKDTLIVADGFSCREQIHQCTDRRALHIAEVMNLALQSEGSSTKLPAYPERLSSMQPARTQPRTRLVVTLSIAAAVVAARAGFSYLARKNRAA